MYIVFECPVCYETFKFTDGNRFAFDSAYALSFTLGFLGTNTSANRRKRGRLVNDMICSLEVPFFYLGNKIRNMNGYGASLYT